MKLVHQSSVNYSHDFYIKYACVVNTSNVLKELLQEQEAGCSQCFCMSDLFPIHCK